MPEQTCPICGARFKPDTADLDSYGSETIGRFSVHHTVGSLECLIRAVLEAVRDQARATRDSRQISDLQINKVVSIFERIGASTFPGFGGEVPLAPPSVRGERDEREFQERSACPAADAFACGCPCHRKTVPQAAVPGPTSAGYAPYRVDCLDCAFGIGQVTSTFKCAEAEAREHASHKSHKAQVVRVSDSLIVAYSDCRAGAGAELLWSLVGPQERAGNKK